MNLKIFGNKKFRMKVFIILLLIIAVFLFIPFNKKSGKWKYAEYIKEDVLYEVLDVFDGDTIVVLVEGHKIIARLIGIDTPEVVDPRKPIQCYGLEASSKAKEILTDSKIYLEKEKTKGDYDIYGRVLVYVYLLDKRSYNKYMIEEGFAKEYTFNKEKYKYQEEFKEAQRKAQEGKKGLWGSCST